MIIIELFIEWSIISKSAKQDVTKWNLLTQSTIIWKIWKRNLFAIRGSLYTLTTAIHLRRNAGKKIAGLSATKVRVKRSSGPSVDRVVSSSAHNRRANVSTRRMTRFTLWAWLGGEIAATRRFTWEILSSVGLPYHGDSRVCTECLDNLSRAIYFIICQKRFLVIELISFLFWFQLRCLKERIYPSGSWIRPGVLGISRQGSHSLAGKAINLVVLCNFYSCIYLWRDEVNWTRDKFEGNDCYFSGTSKCFSSITSAELCRWRVNRFPVTSESR